MLWQVRRPDADVASEGEERQDERDEEERERRDAERGSREGDERPRHGDRRRERHRRPELLDEGATQATAAAVRSQALEVKMLSASRPTTAMASMSTALLPGTRPSSGAGSPGCAEVDRAVEQGHDDHGDEAPRVSTARRSSPTKRALPTPGPSRPRSRR